MNDSKITRRQVLVLGGLTLGVGAVTVTGLSGPAWADSAADVVLVPVGASPVAVLPGVGVQPAAFPRQLAVQVKHAGADLPAGTEVALTYDPRLYSPLPAAVATVGDRLLRTTSSITTDPKTALATCTVTVAEPVAAGSDPVVVVGTAYPVLYPRDLVVGPADATAAVGRKNVKPSGRLRLRPRRPGTFGGVATPWGLEVSGVWSRYEWANGKRWYYFPVQITLQSVGPGPVPAVAAFSISLDPQVVRDVSVTTARLNHKTHDAGVRLLSQTRTASLLETRWSTRMKLKSGDRLDLGVEVRTRKPTGDLPTIKHPSVGLIDMGNHVTQRQTGQTSMSRTDAVWE
ncbi:hypothetical protein AB0D34_35650 [Streptomyces sp. NPDC048420]|uniref:hypothetical protein n=1 Tax=Streptomyces sp. NPDC048420 TaxID=3155755 RepID=UPI00344A30E4